MRILYRLFMKKIYWNLLSSFLIVSCSYCGPTGSPSQRERRKRMLDTVLLYAQAHNNSKGYRRSLSLADDNSELIQKIIDAQNKSQEESYIFQAELNKAQAEVHITKADESLEMFNDLQKKQLSSKQHRKQARSLARKRIKLLRAAQGHCLNGIASYVIAFQISGDETYLNEGENLWRKVVVPSESQRLASKLKKIIEKKEKELLKAKK